MSRGKYYLCTCSLETIITNTANQMLVVMEFPIDPEPRETKDDKKSDWFDGNETIIIIFLLIILVIVAVIILVIMCKKRLFSFDNRHRMRNCKTGRCHCYVNRSFNYRELAERSQENGLPLSHYGDVIQVPLCHCHSQVVNELNCRQNLTLGQLQNANFGYVQQNTSQLMTNYNPDIATSSPTLEVRLPTQNECEPVAHTEFNSTKTSEALTDYTGSENDQDETQPISISNHELFVNIPSQLLVVNERSKTITVKNKEVVYISRKVTDKGDNLVLDGMGISLFVPPGAVKKAEIKTIVLVLNWDLSDNPYMSEKEALVSPVVYVGPHDLKLEKPCTLSFKHCSFDPRNIKVMKSETELTESKDWLEHCTQEDKSGVCVLTSDECQLKIDTFTLYTCLQSPIGTEDCRKWLQVAAFSRPLQSSILHQEVRLYFLNKTPCALQWATQNEAKFGGQMMGPEKVYLFYGNAQDMFISVRYLSDGWENVDKEVEERVPYINIWHGKCPHIAMCFKKHLYPRELTFKLFLYQYSLENEGGHFVAHMIENTHGSSCGGGNESNKHEIIVTLPSVRNNLSNGRPQERSNSEPQVHFHFNNNEVRLEKLDKVTEGYYPHDLKVNLRFLLDPHCPFDKNWKSLAVALGKERCIRYLETRDSPTECILTYAESMKISLATLADVLSCIQREDAADIVRGYIPHTGKPSASENTSDFNIREKR